MAINLDKIEEKAPGLLSLAKSAVKSINDYDLQGQKAKVALVLDYSGSMRNQYRSGAMQRLAEKALVLGTQLDDDGAIDFFVFDSSAAHLGEITLDDYQGSVDRLTGKRRMGTTDYAGAFNAVSEHYNLKPVKRGLFGGTKKADKAAEPVFAIFLTDGAPNSQSAAVKTLTALSSTPIFWKFLSVGSEQIDFLQRLDDLDDRFVDNADYKPIRDVDSISDNDLFDALLDEYPQWLKEVRSKGLI